jgi:hypothetical protein
MRNAIDNFGNMLYIYGSRKKMKKLMFTILIIFNVNVLYSNDLLKDAVYNGNLSPLENRITPQQLMDFNLFELGILRNMIYAKYNYRFQSNDLQEYFSQFSWYSGTENNIENNLTYTDHRNIYIITRLEGLYPAFITYNDERLNDPYYDFGAYGIGHRLIIMGWRNDGKLLATVITGYSDGRDYTFDYYINVARESAEITVNALVLTDIEGYSIYSNEIKDTPYGNYYFEIGLVNNLDNNTIKLGNVSGYGNSRITEDDIFYLCVRSPFEENIIALIVMLPSYAGGNRDGHIVYYWIYGIDLNVPEVLKGF